MKRRSSHTKKVSVASANAGEFVNPLYGVNSTAHLNPSAVGWTDLATEA